MRMKSVARARTALDRLIWGAREAGFLRTFAGVARLVSLAVRRVPRAEVRTTTSGFQIAFNYPSQLMPLLVVFQELLDPELALLPQLLGPGRVAVDIGASIGTWTLAAAKTGAVVHACEPDFENYSALQENVVSNGFSCNVITHDCAFGAYEGWTAASGEASGYSINFKLVANAGGPNAKRICLLDRFAHRVGLTRIDVLKVNTAGCEAEVLIGGRELFRQGKVGVAMFLDGLAVRPLLDELTQFSYELGFYDARKREFIPVDISAKLDNLRPGPINRYVLLKHSGICLHTE